MIRTTSVIAVLGLAALAGCTPDTQDTGGVAKPLESCGKMVSSMGASYREAPILKEGAGKIGIATEARDASGNISQRYSLVDCANKSIVRVDQQWTLDKAPEADMTVQGLVNRLRQEGRLTASGQLARGAQSMNLSVTEGKVNATTNQRAYCGCNLHYPDLLWQ